MNTQRKLRLIGPFMALLLLMIMVGAAPAQQVYDLCVGETTMTMPDGRVVPVWGFGLDNASLNCDTASVPGPLLTVPSAESTLIINLRNTLAEPVSLHILGQALVNDGPVWTQGTSETIAGAISRPTGNYTARVRSFSHETAPGATGQYTWNNFRVGTFMLQSGTNPAKQVQMGLYAPVKKDQADGTAAYPDVTYNKELILVFHEIDPDIHDAIAGGYYGANAGPAPIGKQEITSSVYREPRYFLINGGAYPDARLDPVNGATQIDPNDTVLIRFLNAGLQTHAPQLPERYLTVVAEDGNPFEFGRQQYGLELPAAKSIDATIAIGGAPAAYAPIRLFDATLDLSNGGKATPGGMLAYIKVTDPTQSLLTVTPSLWGKAMSASLPGGINCGSDCDESYNDGTEARLTAIASSNGFFAGAQFLGWAGDGTTIAGDRVVTVSGAGGATVTPNFQNLPAVGVFRNGTWLIDTNGNRLWDGVDIDSRLFFGASGDRPVIGDWNGDGVTDIGVFSNATWYLDMDGDGQLSLVTDRVFVFGLVTDIPVPGDWNGDGITDFGLFRPSTASWYLDANGNGIWDGPATDKIIVFGLKTDIPVTGDWNGDGITDIGLFRPSTASWYLDSNGNMAWNPGVDAKFAFGLATDIPVTGNWNNDVNTEVGVFRNGVWYLDADGNRAWNLPNDLKFTFGLASDIPVGAQ